jgi:hypothetical protein
LLDFAMRRESTPEEPEQQRDKRAAGQQQLYEQVRTELAKLFHACSLRRRCSESIAGSSRAVTTETPPALQDRMKIRG